VYVCVQPGDDYGYFELSDALGVRARVTRFTVADVDAGRVKFVHRGTSQQQLRLQVRLTASLPPPVEGTKRTLAA